MGGLSARVLNSVLSCHFLGVTFPLCAPPRQAPSHHIISIKQMFCWLITTIANLPKLTFRYYLLAVSGEAIPNAENEKITLADRGSSQHLAGEFTTLPRPPSWLRRLVAPSPNPALSDFSLDFQPFGISPPPTILLSPNALGLDKTQVIQSLRYISYVNASASAAGLINIGRSFHT